MRTTTGYVYTEYTHQCRQPTVERPPWPRHSKEWKTPKTELQKKLDSPTLSLSLLIIISLSPRHCSRQAPPLELSQPKPPKAVTRFLRGFCCFLIFFCPTCKMISDLILFYPSFRQTEKKKPNKWQKNRKYSVWGIVCRVQTPRGNRIKRWETSTRRSSRKIKAEARDAFRWKDKQKKKNFRVGDVVRLCFFDDVVQPVPLGYGSYTQEALYSHSFVFIQEKNNLGQRRNNSWPGFFSILVPYFPYGDFGIRYPPLQRHANLKFRVPPFFLSFYSLGHPK